jgi:hypothetical protein
MPTGHRRFIALGSLAATLWLPPSATCDVRADPVEVAVSTGVVWILLGGGLLTLWAAVALVWRLLRGTKTPVVRDKVVWILAAFVVLGWLATVAAVLLSPRPRPQRQIRDGGAPDVSALLTCPLGVDGPRGIG